MRDEHAIPKPPSLPQSSPAAKVESIQAYSSSLLQLETALPYSILSLETPSLLVVIRCAGQPKKYRLVLSIRKTRFRCGRWSDNGMTSCRMYCFKTREIFYSHQDLASSNSVIPQSDAGLKKLTQSNSNLAL